MDEKDLINYIRTFKPPGGYGHVETGPGDDAATINIPERGGSVVASTDMLIEGVHFDSDTPAEKIGIKAVRRALSDLAAMAAEPLCSIVAVSYADDKPACYRRVLCRSIQHEAWLCGVPVAGGDTCSGTAELVIAVTVLGYPGEGGLVGRGGARPGDSICVTGLLGGAAYGGRHLVPAPRVQQSLELVKSYEIHAMIDISDGLSTDMLHILDESNAGALLYADSVPLHPDAVSAAEEEGRGERGAFMHALGDGEDYELLFCLSPDAAEKLAFSGIDGVNVSIIGKITDTEKRIIIWPDGKETELRDTGWQHLIKK